jgi:hypothetical protein
MFIKRDVQSSKLLTSNLNENDLLLQDLLSSKCDWVSCFLEPSVIVLGLIFNLLFLIIIFKNNENKVFKSTKPMRYLLVGMLIGDISYLISSFNGHVMPLMELPDLTSFNVICQLSVYFYNYFAILAECFMFTANILMLYVLYPGKITSPQSFYSDFLKEKKGFNKQWRIKFQQLFFSKEKKSSTECDVTTANEGSYETNELNEVRGFSQQTPKKSNTFVIKKLLKKYNKKQTFLLKNCFEKKKNIYSIIVTREKFFIILFGFIWLYLLSFILWTEGKKKL